MNRPYGVILTTVPRDHDNPVEMIWHNGKFIQNNIAVMIDQIEPNPGNNIPGGIRYHPPGFDFTEQMFPVLYTGRDEIGTGPRIIVSLQTDRPAMACDRIVFHIVIPIPLICPRQMNSMKEKAFQRA